MESEKSVGDQRQMGILLLNYIRLDATLHNIIRQNLLKK